ncbi:MAG: hypothetical protein WCI73_21210, partial [Phycisphaerae bacterium]
LEAAGGGVKGEWVERLAREGQTQNKGWVRRAALLARARKAVHASAWTQAAEIYGELAQQENLDWPLYLQGYALMRAGMKPEGLALQQRAHLLMLASWERMDLAWEADKAGLPEVALAEGEWILRLSRPLGVMWMNGAQTVAFAPGMNAERAGRILEEHNVIWMGSGASFLTASSDHELLLARLRHEFAAQAALERKDWERVTTEMKAALELYPAYTDKMLEIVPRLDAAGRKAQADSLVKIQVDYYEAVLAQYPRAASHHNLLAWLCARTGRELDTALRHAEIAVGYMPKSAGFLDTLAEANFARGNVAEAIAIEKRAVEMEPAFEVLRTQLKRFESAGQNKEKSP